MRSYPHPLWGVPAARPLLIDTSAMRWMLRGLREAARMTVAAGAADR